MKLAIFTLYLNKKGGVERIVDFYLKKMAADENVKVTCFALQISDEIKDDYAARVKFKELKFPLINPLLAHLCFFIWASSIILFSKFDVYYAHFPIFSFNKKFIYHCHSVHKKVIRQLESANALSSRLVSFLRRYYPLPIILEKLVFSRNKHKKFIAVSPKIKREIIQEYKIPEKLIDVASAPINLDNFDFSRRNNWQKELRKNYDFFQKENYLWLGTVANRLTGKNIRLVLEALAKKSGHLGLVVVGLPRPKDIKKLNKWIQEFRLENNVFLITALLNIERIYPAFDFFVLPSVYESFGLSVMEALLSGVQAIVSKEIGCLEFLPTVVKEKMLIVADNIKNPEELAAIFKELASPPELGKETAILTDHVKKLNVESVNTVQKLLHA